MLVAFEFDNKKKKQNVYEKIKIITKSIDNVILRRGGKKI